MEKIKVLVVSILFAGVLTVSANERDQRGCEGVYGRDAKINCIKLNKVNRKLNHIIKLLEYSDVGHFGDLKKVEYTCRANIAGNKFFEGYGSTPELARKNFFLNCEKAYSRYSCSRSGLQCDFQEHNPRAHFYCEISRFTGASSVIRGMGLTKKDALNQALNMCSVGSKVNDCLKRVKKCYEKDFN